MIANFCVPILIVLDESINIYKICEIKLNIILGTQAVTIRYLLTFDNILILIRLIRDVYSRIDRKRKTR